MGLPQLRLWQPQDSSIYFLVQGRKKNRTPAYVYLFPWDNASPNENIAHKELEILLLRVGTPCSAVWLVFQPYNISFSHHSSSSLQLQSGNSVFLSHHSSLQLQPAERSVRLRVLIVATTHGQQLAENSLVLDLHETESRFTDATGQARYNPGTYG